MAQSGTQANVSKATSFRSATSVGQFPASPSKKKSAMYFVDEQGGPPRITPQQSLDEESDARLFAAKRMLVAVWIETHTDMKTLCPMEGLEIAGAWWNVAVTHYYELDDGRVCHFVVPQYNIHGNYVLGTELVAPSKTSPANCKENSYFLEYYFYHGSIGYYAFYEEAVGTLCANDNIGYVRVRGLGTYDNNGAHLANDFGIRRIDYRIVEGLMSDLFMLIAQDGLLAKVQYISLGYNLSGIMSMLFEMVETMNWMRETLRCLIKRLLFNYETALIGELVCSAAMQFYLTGLNKSSLLRSKPVAQAVSYYVWSLVGHGIIVLGIVSVITSIRSIGAIISVRWTFGSFSLLWTPCCVDTAIGQRCKMILLSGYVWEDGRLCYKAETLKSFGIMKMVEEDSTHFIVLHRLRWLAIPQDDLMVIGEINGNNVTRCDVRPCTGMRRGSVTQQHQKAASVNGSYYFEHYFYRSSIDYYSFYEEAQIATRTRPYTFAFGVLDMNGAKLAEKTTELVRFQLTGQPTTRVQ
ncbi:hypothetical protein GQ600_14365 [Phytophthora cactorum]|nr:hypothetical protein GQ600_14365 [Phytophthora cactorum]